MKLLVPVGSRFRALSKSKFNSKSKLLFRLSGSRSGDNGESESMVAEGSGVAKQSVGSVGGGQFNGGQLNRLGGGGDGGGSQEAAVQAVAVDGGCVHVADGAGHQGVVAVLRLLQLDQLGVGRSVGLDRLKCGRLVLDGLLCHGGHRMHCAKPVASIDKLGSPVAMAQAAERTTRNFMAD